MMRVGILLFAVLLAVVPAVAKGSHGGSGRSSGSHFYSSRSYHPRSSASPYRSHSYSTHASRRHSSYSGHRSYRTASSRSHASGSGSAQRDSHGKIKRSEAAKDAFKRQQPCPATGKSTGACPGYVIDHVKPLANGGADDPSNMQWQTKEAAKEKDKWERKQ
jgi:hypothetical protein